jgi:hypothetical protein
MQVSFDVLAGGKWRGGIGQCPFPIRFDCASMPRHQSVFVTVLVNKDLLSGRNIAL